MPQLPEKTDKKGGPYHDMITRLRGLNASWSDDLRITLNQGYSVIHTKRKGRARNEGHSHVGSKPRNEFCKRENGAHRWGPSERTRKFKVVYIGQKNKENTIVVKRNQNTGKISHLDLEESKEGGG